MEEMPPTFSARFTGAPNRTVLILVGALSSFHKPDCNSKNFLEDSPKRKDVPKRKDEAQRTTSQVSFLAGERKGLQYGSTRDINILEF